MRKNVLVYASTELSLKALWIVQTMAQCKPIRSYKAYLVHTSYSLTISGKRACIKVTIMPTIRTVLPTVHPITIIFDIAEKDTNPLHHTLLPDEMLYGTTLLYTPKIDINPDVISEEIYMFERKDELLDFQTFTEENEQMTDLINTDGYRYPIRSYKDEPVLRMIMENQGYPIPSYIVVLCHNAIGGVDMNYHEYIACYK